jgi:hypothetical protein
MFRGLKITHNHGHSSLYDGRWQMASTAGRSIHRSIILVLEKYIENHSVAIADCACWVWMLA